MHVSFSSGELHLEGILEMKAGSRRAAVICHPHPQYGGNMFSNVVHALHDALHGAGYSTLRFNFRGVGESEGVYGGGKGERDDAACAVAFVAEQTDATEITLAGYSFGAMVAVQLAPDVPIVQRLIAIAPPLAFFNLSGLRNHARPKLFVVGDRDEYCSTAQLQGEVAQLAEPADYQIVPGADHFFFGYEPELRRIIAAFAV